MNELQDVFIVVAKVFIYLGATMFGVCFLFGAYTFYHIFKTTLTTIELTARWNSYHKMTPEAKLEFLKNSNLNPKG